MMHKVHIAIVLDRSGSMEDARADVVSAVNSYLRQLRQDEALDARLSVVAFDSHGIDTIRDRVPAGKCQDIGIEEYEPRGATPLLDAVGYSVGIFDCLSGKDERRIMAIVTDGLENASREYTREQLRTLLVRKQREEDWLIVYLGAGHDSWSQAGQIGIDARHTADFSMNALNEAADVLRAVGTRFLERPRGVLAARDSGLTREERTRLMRGGSGHERRAMGFFDANGRLGGNGRPGAREG